MIPIEPVQQIRNDRSICSEPLDQLTRWVRRLHTWHGDLTIKGRLHMELTKEQRLGEIVALRTKMRTMPDLRADLNDAVRNVLASKGITLDPDISPDLIFA